MKKRNFRRSKTISYLLASTLALSACSEAPNSDGGNSEGSELPAPSSPGPEHRSKPLPPDNETASKVFTQWRKLIEGPSPDLALAQMLAGTVSELAPEESNRLMKEIDSWSLSDVDLNKKIEEFKEGLSKSYLQNRLRLTLSDRNVDSSIVAHSIFASSDKNLFASDQMSAIVDLSLRSYLHNKSYQALTQTYAEALKEATEMVARDLLSSMKRDQPTDLDKILAAVKNALQNRDQIETDVREVISRSRKLSICIDHIRERVGSEQVGTIILEQVSSEIVNSLMRGSPIFPLRHSSAQFEQKVSEIFVFKSTLVQEAKKLHSDLKDLGHQSQSIVDSIAKKKNLLKDVTAKIRAEKGVDKVELEEAESLAVSRVYGGTGGVENRKLNEWENFISSAQTSVDRIDNICGTAMSLAQQLGIQVDPNIQKVVKTVSQVNQALQIGQSLAAAFATGGASALLSAFGGLGGLTGAGGPDLSGIESELAQIREQQQVIIQNELKIMEMVKDLAEMIGQFHEEEMAQLYIIDQDVKDTASIMTMMNWGNCKKMLSALPQSLTTKEFLGLSWSQGFQTYSRFSGATGIQKYLSDTVPYYSPCMTTLGSTLSPVVDGEAGSDLKSSILRYTVSGDDKDSQFLEGSIYQPLLEFTLKNKREYGLDVPAAHLSILESKYHAFADPAASSAERLQLNYLLSAKRLQVYVLSYLNLRPWIQIGSHQWSETFGAVDEGKEIPQEQKLKNFLSSSELRFAHSRSVTDLKAVLDLIQSAVAQESILAGEPVLDLLAERLPEIFSQQVSPLSRSIRANNILLINLLSYVVAHTVPPEMWGSYEQARINNDGNQLIAILGHGAGEALRGHLVVDASTHTLRVQVPAAMAGAQTISLELPTLAQLQTGKVLYRSTMGRLVDLQSRVMDELKNLTVSPLSPTELKKLSAVLMIQARAQKETK
jgi:hypothetical protein